MGVGTWIRGDVVVGTWYMAPGHVEYGMEFGIWHVE